MKARDFWLIADLLMVLMHITEGREKIVQYLIDKKLAKRSYHI